MYLDPHMPQQVEFDFMGRPVTAHTAYDGMTNHMHAGLAGYAYVDITHHKAAQDDKVRTRRIERNNTKRDSRMDVSIHLLEPDYRISSMFYDFSYNTSRRRLIDRTFASMMYADPGIDYDPILTERIDGSTPFKRKLYVRQYLSQGAHYFDRPNILTFGESPKYPTVATLDVPTRELAVEINQTADARYDIIFRQNGVEYTTRFHRNGEVDLKTATAQYADELCFAADGQLLRVNYPALQSLQT